MEESKMKYGKKGNGKVNNNENEIEIVKVDPAESVTATPADTKLVERRRQSKVDRLLA